MRSPFVVITLTGLIMMITASSTNAIDTEKQFHDFMSKYGKTYATEKEYQYRLGVFKSNLDLIASRNEAQKNAGGAAVHGNYIVIL